MLETVRHGKNASMAYPDFAAPVSAPTSRLTGREVLGLLRRRKWTVLATMAGVFALALLVTSQLERRYTATALIAVDSRDAQLVGFEPGVIDGIGNAGIVDTEVEIARSSAVLSRAAERLDLASWPEFAARPPLLDTLGSMIGIGAESEAPAAPAAAFADLPDTERARILKELSEILSIGRRGLTSVVAISATTTSPERAATLANAVAEAYLQEQIEAKLSSTERAAGFLRTRVDRIAGDISALETELDTFLTTKLAEAGSPETRALMLKLGESTRLRDEGATTLAGLQAALRSRDYQRLAVLADGGQSTFARERATLVEALADTDQAKLASAKEKLAALDDEIRAAAERRVSSVQSEVTDADNRIATLRREIDVALSQQQLPKDFSVELFRLQRDIETRRVLYDSFLTKLGQVEQQTDFNLPDSRIVAAATPPDKASYPPLNAIAAGTLFLSLIAGCGLAILREHFIGGVSSPEQLETLTRMPVVSAVPRLPSSQGGDRPDAVIVTQPLSVFSEAIRRLRLGVEAFAPGDKLAIFVTSPLPGDGKTTIAMALARQMAATGSKTLLIDADMRHPSVAAALDQAPKDGLIDFLSKPAGDVGEQISIFKEAASGVDFVLGAGPSAVATDALLMSNRFADLMRFAREAYDVVIVDTPPIGLVVDARIVARYCDAGVFVVRYAATSQHHIRSSLNELAGRLDIPVCGVLNQVQRNSGYAYGYGRKYDRYYASAPRR